MNRRLFFACASAAAIYPGLMGCRAQALGAPPGLANSGDAAFDAWLNDFYPRAVATGLPEELLNRELANLKPDPAVLAADRNQPEIARPVSAYVKSAVSDSRVATGLAKKADLTWLADVETQYGVPPQVLIALWGLESSFGTVQGDFDVIRTAATLAADGRRRPLFEGSLLAALRIIALGEATRAQLKGSNGGAMGQTQFAPADYLRSAVDGDGDGKRDIWGSTRDALTSSANFLARAGWKRGESWQREVTVPEGFDFSVVEGPKQVPSVWMVSGVKATDGAGWSALDAAAPAQLITPSGAGGPAFLVFPNHFTLRAYNNSTSYALGVGLLASRIGGERGVIKAWPQETGLSTAERTGAQNALTQLGYDPGGVDGIIGTGTRAAVRKWQKDKGLIADGYLTPELSHRLQAEAAAARPAPLPSN